MESITGKSLDLMANANMSWVRKNAVVWSSIEASQGSYDWSGQADLETQLKNASSNGFQVVLIVRSTPEWARKTAGTGSTCGPIAQNKLAAFGNFMNALVKRYSVAPYNVKYWEMWNEEDGPEISGDNIWGCWGDPSDTYYGGGYYAEMLKAAYPRIKSADSQAQVVIGGLLMDCDPRPGAGCAIQGHDPKQSLFLEGILSSSGIGSAFDGISYHAYDYYQGQSGYYYNPNWQSAWNTTGPVGFVKAQYIRDLLTQHSISSKFLLNTESALLCSYCSNNTRFEGIKAAYIAQTYASAIAKGLRANIWYSLVGWNGSGLVDASGNPLPGYTAFRFGRLELRDAAWVSDITAYTGVKGYVFNRGDRRIWIMWSVDGSTHSVSLSGTPLAAWDTVGVYVPPATSMDVTVNPLYLEWNP
jgi:hypothetical protein